MKLGLFITTTFFAGAAFVLGLYTTSDLIEGVDARTLSPLEGNTGTLFFFLMLLAAATAFMLLVSRMTRSAWIYRIVFSLVSFIGLLKLFETIFPLEFSALVAMVCLIGLFLIPTIWTHDIIIVLASAGMGPVFALQFSEYTALLLLIILSLYDSIAVFVTKHMITLAHAMIRSHATFALIIPERLRDIRASIAAVKPGAGFLILGGGDLVIPMIYLSAIAREQIGIASAGIMGILIGMFCNHLFLVTIRRPLPALPLISLGAVGGVTVARTLL